MKKIFNFLRRYCYTIIFIIISVLLLPPALIRPAQSESTSMVLAMAVDEEDEEMKVSLQILTPQSSISNNKNLQIVSDSGGSLLEVINKISVKLGSHIGFEHTAIIVFNEEMAKKDVINNLDYIFRNTKINFNTILVVAQKSGEELLKQSAEINTNSSGSLQNNFGFNYEYFGANKIATIGSFFNDYYSYSKTSFVPYIKQEDSEKDSSNEQGSGSSSGGEQGGSSQGGGQSGGSSGATEGQGSVESVINNEGYTALFKDGKIFKVITGEETMGFDWLDNISMQGILSVKGVTGDNIYHNAEVTVQIEKYHYSVKPVIKNNQLVFKAKSQVYCYVSEIVQDTKDIQLMQGYAQYLTKTLKDKCVEKIKQDVDKALNFCKENNIDCFEFYNTFYKHNKNGLKKILRLYGEDYLQACKIELDVDIISFK